MYGNWYVNLANHRVWSSRAYACVRAPSNSDVVFLLSQVSHAEKKVDKKQPEIQWNARSKTGFPIPFTPNQLNSNHLIVDIYSECVGNDLKTSEIQLSCDTCDSKKVKTPVMRACAYAREDGFIGIFTIQFPRFSICTFPCRSFPLHCVLKNKPLLLSKRHVVFHKTSRRFF